MVRLMLRVGELLLRRLVGVDVILIRISRKIILFLTPRFVGRGRAVSGIRRGAVGVWQIHARIMWRIIRGRLRGRIG